MSFQEASGLVKKEELKAQHAAQSEAAKDPKAEKKSAWVEKMKAMMKEKEDEKASNDGKSSTNESSINESSINESSNNESNALHSSSKPSVSSEDAMKERVKEKIRAMKQKSMEVRLLASSFIL